jgi:hypothetical protein
MINGSVDQVKRQPTFCSCGARVCRAMY